jgi:DNA-binding NtrC family response regulator
MTPRRILIVDDEQGIRAALGQLLEFEGYEVRAVGNAVDGIAEYQKQRPDLVFLDVKMAGIDGVEALKKIKEIDPSAIVVMISGHATAFSSHCGTRWPISICTRRTRGCGKRSSRDMRSSASRTRSAA